MTVSGQSQTCFTTGGLPPISSFWRQTPWGSRPNIFLFLQLNHCGRSPYVTSTLTRGSVSSLTNRRRLCQVLSIVHIACIHGYRVWFFLPGKWPASSTGHLITGERTYWIGSLVCPRAGLEAVKKISLPRLEWKPSAIYRISYYRILTMVYNFQRYWVFGLYPSSWY
jgi:hypothetical protein